MTYIFGRATASGHFEFVRARNQRYEAFNAQRMTPMGFRQATGRPPQPPEIMDAEQRAIRERRAMFKACERQLRKIVRQEIDAMMALQARQRSALTLDQIKVLEAGGPSINDIISAFCTVANVSVYDLLSEARGRFISRPRQVAMLLVSDLRPDLSTPALGLAFDRDHTTVLWARIRATEHLAGLDPEPRRWFYETKALFAERRIEAVPA